MRDRQDIVLGKGIEKRESELIVIEGPIYGVEGHIAQHIVHPAHVPFEVEAQSADIRWLCDQRPCSGLLGYHKSVGVLAEHSFIEVLEELYRFKVLIAAIYVSNPFTRFPVIIKIKNP